MRKKWDRYFLDIAKAVSERSTCPKASVGAIVVKHNKIIGTGYNGSPPKAPHCVDDGCAEFGTHCIATVHAEVNAVLQALRVDDLKNATIYCTHRPCIECCKIIVASGISHVLYELPYYDDRCKAFKVKTQDEYLFKNSVQCYQHKDVVYKAL